MDQPKMERLLRLMMMLTANHRYTLDDIAERLDMSVRTIYRYIDTFREAGFVIKKTDDFVRIDKSSPYFKDISELVHFTEEEAFILKRAIESIDDTNLMKQNLKRKLASVYDYRILADITVKSKNAEVVQILADAMTDHKQVVLLNYSSSHSGKSVAKRIVEPFKFTTNYVQFWAYEPISGMNKLFQTARVESAEIGNDWQYETKHRSGFIDLFRFSGDTQHHVKLRMGRIAANLLVEEYPLAEKELLQESDDKWLLDTKVCNYLGVGRFYLGLMNDVEIVDSLEFKEFIRSYIEKYSPQN